MKSAVIATPVGHLLLCCDGEAIVGVSFAEPPETEEAEWPECGLLKRCKDEITLYFEGKLRDFAVPLKPEGTDFRKKCWEALRTIPYGKTIAYKELAVMVNNPKASRAVGQANHRNPIAIIVPCHRVIGAGGKLTGFGGGLEKKQFLLEHEQKHLPTLAKLQD